MASSRAQGSETFFWPSAGRSEILKRRSSRRASARCTASWVTKEHDVLSYHDQKMFEGRWEVKQPNGFIADSGYWCVQRDQFPADESVHIKFYIDKGFPPETKDL